MARSHTCPSCTAELGRIRAVPDPIYALPVVVCPSCNAATVRHKHHDLAFWRAVRRTFWGARRIFHTTAATTLTILFAMGVAGAGQELVQEGRATLKPLVFAFTGDAVVILALASVVMLFAFTTRLLTAHTRFWVTPTVLVALSALASFADQIVYHAAAVFDRSVADTVASGFSADSLGARLFFLALACGAILAACTLAHLARPIQRFAQRTKRRRIRKKVTKRTRQQD